MWGIGRSDWTAKKSTPIGRREAGREVALLGLSAWVSPACVERDASGSRR